MSKQRQEQLSRRLGKKLSRSLDNLLPPDQGTVVDFVIFYPPDEDDGLMNVLANLDGEEASWDFQIEGRDWRVRGDKSSDADCPRDLFPDLKQFFRACWRDVLSRSDVAHSAYLRIHDSIDSVNLKNGRRISDDLRPDIQARSTIDNFKKVRTTQRKKAPKPTPFRLDDTPKRVQNLLKTDRKPQPFRGGVTEMGFGDLGLRMYFKNNKAYMLHFFPPYAESIDGIWIGAHASIVQKVLGTPARESYVGFNVGGKKCHRRWTYPKRHLHVNFDYWDCVQFIQKSRSL